MQEYFRPTPKEFLELARFWAETRCYQWLDRIRPDRDGNAADDMIVGHASERLDEIAAEVQEEDVAAIVAEVEDRHRQLIGDDLWQVLKEGTPEQRQKLLEELAERERHQEPKEKKDGFVEGVTIHHVTTGVNTKGWIHTHGMDQFGLPELEIRNVPSYFIDAAARILREVCRYMKKPDVVVRVGETMAVSPKTLLRLGRAEPIPESQDHYEVERWQIVEVEPACDECWGRETHFGQSQEI